MQQNVTTQVSSNVMSEAEYVQEVLSEYRQTPGTVGTIHRADRIQATRWYADGVALDTVRNALTLAAARRLCRSAELPSLQPIRSLAYFGMVINEVRDLKVDQEYFIHVRQRLRRLRNS